MSKTKLILLILSLVWFAAWETASYFMRQGAAEQLAQADYLSTPAIRLEPGADVRVEGTIVDGPPVAAPYSQKPCLAAVTDIAAVSFYTTANNKTARDRSLVATRREGPANIEIAAGDTRIELPLERWSPKHGSVEEIDELPARLGVTPEEIARAKEPLRGQFARFSIAESTIDGGTRVFVVGRLEDRDGPPRLEADPVLGRIELYPGSRDDLVNDLRGAGGGLRIAGWILGAVVGPLPLAVLGLVSLAEWRRRSAPPGARSPG
jgi:hypothetical protein